MKNWQKTISVMAVVALLLVFGWSSPVLETNAQSQELDQLRETAEKISVEENSGEIEKIKNIAYEAITNKKVVSNAVNAELNFDRANVGEVFAENETYTVLAVPIASDEYSPISNLTLIIQDGKILTYSETLMTKSPKNTVAVASYTDGQLINEKVTDVEYVSNSEVKAAIDKAQKLKLDENTIQPFGIAEVSLCLSAVLLIDLVVARMVATACIGFCGTGVVPLCAACIGGVFVIGGANINAVTACFSQM